MSYFVIGDIHGSVEQLRALLKWQAAYRGRRVLFLGDFVDWGLHSREVVDELLAFRAANPDTLCLLGNHDAALLRYLQYGDFAQYAAMGGIPTLRSYCGDLVGNVWAQVLHNVPSHHVAFFRGLVPYFETDQYLFSHCGCVPDRPLDRSLEAMVYRSHERLFDSGIKLPKLAICGHYFRKTHKPFVSDYVVCLDTGCGVSGGPLTALQLPEMVLVQVDANLRVAMIASRRYLQATALSGSDRL